MRLIDADTLVKDLLEQIPLAENVPIFKDIIESQSTTYDVDKVVEQLNKAKKYNLDLADTMLDIQKNGTTRYFICLEDAIKIVKAGGNKNE